MKTYQIYASSKDTITPATTASFTRTNDSLEYLFDWSIIPEGEYEMTFSYVSEYTKLTHAKAVEDDFPIKVEIIMPFSTDKYQVNTSGVASSSQILGFLFTYDGFQDSTHVMRQTKATYSDNAPVHIRGKPQGNRFKIHIIDHTSVLSGGARTEPYDLVITLKHLC